MYTDEPSVVPNWSGSDCRGAGCFPLTQQALIQSIMEKLMYKLKKNLILAKQCIYLKVVGIFQGNIFNSILPSHKLRGRKYGNIVLGCPIKSTEPPFTKMIRSKRKHCFICHTTLFDFNSMPVYFAINI